MMWGYGGNMAWTWGFGLLMLVGIILLVLLAARMFSGGADRGGTSGGDRSAGAPGRSPARLILDERFAKGEMTAEDYNASVLALGEHTQ